MKTGRFKLRRGFGGKAILQYEIDTPSLIGGQVASDVRQRSWHDVEYDKLANIAVFLSAPTASQFADGLERAAEVGKK